MKTFKDLTPEDFPGVDPVKFEEWKKARQFFLRSILISLVIAVVLTILIFQLRNYKLAEVLAISIWLGVGVVNVVCGAGFRGLSKGLGITTKKLNQALKD